MSASSKRYLDQEGLQVFWNLIKEYIKKKTEVEVEEKPLYYKTDGSGNILYNYNEAHGLAQNGITYYERSGSGTDIDPYVYTETEDEIIPGVTEVDGYYTKGNAQTTIEPTEDEMNYPVIDPQTGEQVVVEAIEVDPETEKMVLAIIEGSDIPDETIPNEDILDLWS